jgi:cyanate permease
MFPPAWWTGPRPCDTAGVPAAPALLLGHASGFSWDESLLVMAPIAGLALLLWLANRRAARLGGDDQHEDDPDQEPSDHP